MKRWIVVNDDTQQFCPLDFEGDDEGTAIELAFNFSGFVGTRSYELTEGADAPSNYELWKVS